MNQEVYEAVLKSYDEGDFEFFDLKNDLYYQLFYGGADYEEMDATKIVPIIFKIEDILTNRGVFINSACDS